MGKIIISTNSSFDGVVQDPDGKDGFAFGGWFDQVIGDDRPEWAQYFVKEALGASALLMGRTSDEWFASRWLGRTGEWANKLNGMPKYIVSSTLEHTAWSNGTVISGDLATEVAKLKHEIDGEILVYGSFQLGHALIEQDLVDEIRLMILPVLVGDGTRLFGTTAGIRPLRLTHTATIGDGITSLAYEVLHKG
ncbi:dihydrofolate reductase family protein [Catenulispora rubra]|uniref:dihydrofolate reductase family protein n=1 Tax=Catenulispora rubra TaxID=280293 RepID=UPI0018920849|nr:dihydrofolate reductase family protein [Catenulispora rubra]